MYRLTWKLRGFDTQTELFATMDQVRRGILAIRAGAASIDLPWDMEPRWEPIHSRSELSSRRVTLGEELIRIGRDVALDNSLTASLLHDLHRVVRELEPCCAQLEELDAEAMGGSGAGI